MPPLYRAVGWNANRKRAAAKWKAASIEASTKPEVKTGEERSNKDELEKKEEKNQKNQMKWKSASTSVSFTSKLKSVDKQSKKKVKNKGKTTE